MITVQLLPFQFKNTVGSTNGLNPTDLKTGRVWTQGPSTPLHKVDSLLRLRVGISPLLGGR